MTLEKTLLWALGTMLLAGIGGAVASRRSVQMLEAELNQATGQTTEKLALSGDLKAAANIMRTGQRGILLNAMQHDAAAAEATRKDYQKHVDTAVALVGRLRLLPLNVQETGQLDALESAIGQHVNCFRQVSDLSAAGNLDEAAAVYKETGAPAGAAMERKGSELMASETALMKESAARGHSTIAKALWMSIAAPAVWILCLMFAVWMVRNVNRRLRAISRRVAEGAAQIESAAGEVATSSRSMAKGASEQSVSLEETSAAVNEAAARTQNNAQSARTAASVMTTVDERVKAGNRTLGEMASFMREISESAGKISRIISVIDEIAFQTNILALNAAVEAARAGEAGMGFAVVADEVRNLAQRSAQAARDTGSLIETSIAKSSQGGDRLQEVAKAINGITESTVEAKALIDRVDTASHEQAGRIQQISEAAGQIEKVTQNTAALAERSAAASQNLAAQASGMHDIVCELEALIGA